MILVSLSGGPRSAAALAHLVGSGKRCKALHVRRPGREAEAERARETAESLGVAHEEIFLDLGCDVPDAIAAAIALPHAVCACRDCMVHAIAVGRMDPWAKDVFLALMDQKFLFVAPVAEEARSAAA